MAFHPTLCAQTNRLIAASAPYIGCTTVPKRVMIWQLNLSLWCEFWNSATSGGEKKEEEEEEGGRGGEGGGGRVVAAKYW